ncbi:class II aldolase/adducin family protein [Acidipropionibacterium timonense]|uniref:class II aldolase/adducin family protein n=1 Tax=Acidipropionibacterium timonense TaxID=2161818 RepID=UPI001436A006|nr:class II aldolase/adducin family protein [Acidipropionibacterium timonense]
MLHEHEREEIIAYCLRMLEDDLTLGTSGNISVRVDDHVLKRPRVVVGGPCHM